MNEHQQKQLLIVGLVCLVGVIALRFYKRKKQKSQTGNNIIKSPYGEPETDQHFFASSDHHVKTVQLHS